VWVVAEDGTASARVVRPGPRIDGYRIVRDGLGVTRRSSSRGCNACVPVPRSRRT
jgi:hypothetical protein